MLSQLKDYLRAFLAKRNLSLRHLLYGLIILVLLVVSSIKLLNISPYTVSSGTTRYVRAKVLSVRNVTSGIDGVSQNIRSKILDGPDKGKVVVVTRSLNFGDASYKRMPVGSEVLLTKDTADGSQYSYGDRWHIVGVVTIALILLALVVLVGWWRGITSLFGLAIGIGIISEYIIPRIISGHSPYATCIQGAFIITLISVYVAHGFNKRTSVALISCLITLFLIISLVALSTYLTGTSEVIGDDTSSALVVDSKPISLDGLLTGGIVIASLGVLYDITTGQAAAVDELYKANKKLSTAELYNKALSVGREHVAALVNTLVLVYVGIALPSIILTVLYSNHAPFIVTLNNETIVEEIVRTFVASSGMLVAVPITTLLAAYLLPRWYKNPRIIQSWLGKLSSL